MMRDVRIIAQDGHGFQREIEFRQRPCIILLVQDRADEADEGGFVEKDAADGASWLSPASGEKPTTSPMQRVPDREDRMDTKQTANAVCSLIERALDDIPPAVIWRI